MTRSQAAQLLPVIQAWAEGKAIQCRSLDCGPWIDATPTESPNFGSCQCEWRVKPEPRRWHLFQDINGKWNVLSPKACLSDGEKAICVQVVEVTP